MVGEAFLGLGSDPLPHPPVFVEDLPDAPLPPPEVSYPLYPVGRVSHSTLLSGASRSAPENALALAQLPACVP